MLHEPSAGTSVEHAYLGKNVRVIVLLTFKLDSVKKQRHLKIYSLEFDEVWQKSCQHTYHTSVTENLY